MGESPTSNDKPVSEAIATTGLFLNFTSVIATVVCLARWGASDYALAAVAGLVGALTFIASIVCFAAQAEDRGHQTII
jgi:hypothetical protein